MPSLSDKIRDGDTTVEDERLADAAPDLYAACEAALEFVYSPGVLPVQPKPHPIQAQLRSALAKARGEN